MSKNVDKFIIFKMYISFKGVQFIVLYKKHGREAVMKNFKRKIFLFLCIILLFTFPVISFAHSGRTDSSGGHHDYNNKSGLGSYHYHHGMGAHLHPDGVCPYGNNSSSSAQSSTTYTPPKPKVTVNNPPSNINVGDICGLEINLENVENTSVSITSSDCSVVRVNRDNTLTAMGAGTATINIEASSATTSFTVNVSPVEVEEIKLDSEIVEVQLDNVTKITPTVLPKNATDKSLTYKSENESIVSVYNGNLTGMSVGETNISITSHNGISTSVKVNVFEVFPDEIEVGVDKLKLEVNDTYEFNINILPENANNKNYTIFSEDEEILKCESDNKVVAVKDGNTKVIIKTENDIIKEIPVEVFHIPVEKVKINDEKIDYIFSNIISDKTQIVLDAKVEPDDASFTDVKWSTSNDTIVSINNNKFQIKGTGKVTIVADTYDGANNSITFYIIDVSNTVGICMVLILCFFVLLKIIIKVFPK